MTHNKGDEKESFVEVINQMFIPGQTQHELNCPVSVRGQNLFTSLCTLLDSYSTGQIYNYYLSLFTSYKQHLRPCVDMHNC